MTQAAAGTSKKGLFSRDDYLAPPHISTGQPPRDMLNIIWRKNDVFLDIGSYSIGSALMVIWPVFLIFALAIYNERNEGEYFWGMLSLAFFMLGIPILVLLYSLIRPVPSPVRFNRQRREVCVPQKDGSYWIVPWEQVSAAATAVSSIGQHGKTTQGLLVVGFTNPDPDATEENKHFSLGFSCGGGIPAMRLWECIRSYMEVGPEAVPDTRLGRRPYEETQMGSIVTSLRKGDIKDVMQGLFFVVFLGTYFAEKLQNWKLVPPPDLTDPDIAAWSRPLPPEQWARRSIELERTVAEREADLAGETPGI
ncbi:hypothetical protein SAMN05216198_2337 [Halopseudomonas litoralis]|uniref:DUF6708 domain-containing protein n=1 Tax=Halopseudomonas litoralis TaxID=797277 RepID=A0A1H1TN70_9GAMM|nr:DUF6708 domain-containing protein [Halopseudomonas litoralis]SDS61009.1 hypothetical protein SAMN05216198_2337 [Halopseudomonas litoralis]